MTIVRKNRSLLDKKRKTASEKVSEKLLYHGVNDV